MKRATRRQESRSPRERLLMDFGWRFHLGDFPTSAWLNSNEKIVKWRWKLDDEGEASAAEVAAVGSDTSGSDWQELRPADTLESKAGELHAALDMGASPKGEELPPQPKYSWLRAELGKVAGPGRTLAFGCLHANAIIYFNGRECYRYIAYLGDPVDVSLDEDWQDDGENVVTVMVEGIATPDRIGRAFVRGGSAARKRAGPASPVFDDSRWRKLDLPHDFVVEGGYDPKAESMHGYRRPGAGWYRRVFTIPARDRGKRIWVEFDGIYRDSRMWLNGHYLGNHRSGYTSFFYDVTDYIEYGRKNVLAIRVDSTVFEGWWYEGGGVYRHVWLTKLSPSHVSHWGVFVTSEVKQSYGDGRGRARVTVQTTVENQSAQKATLMLRSEIQDAGGETVGAATSEVVVKAGQAVDQKQALDLPNATLWSPENPHLYQLITTLHGDGETSDVVVTPVGVRSIQFDCDRGFLLNGQPTKIQGTCNHQDFAGVGIALPDRIHVFKIEKLKEMGANGYRCSHHPPAPEILDTCDRLGMLVMDEHRALGDTPEILSQVESMVLRDRNHPSIIIWSLCNEEMVLQGTERGREMGRAMAQIIRRLDPTRPVTAAMNAEFGKGLTPVLDVQGFNYSPDQYDAFHQTFPRLPAIGTEIGGSASSRGCCLDDGVRGYLRGYTTRPESAWHPVMERAWMSGGFIWTGFAYGGEPYPYEWPCVNSQLGAMDLCGFPKDDYYYYKAWWGDQPIVHLAPHWNWAYMMASWAGGHEVGVWCYSNCEQVELLQNGHSLGIKEMPKWSHLEWKLEWRPGVLSAKGYRNGEVVATAQVETTELPFALRLTPDRRVIDANGQDVSLVKVEVVDHGGRVVPTAGNQVAFSVSPNARIIGVGNGDPCSHEPDKATARRAFNGLCMVIVQSTRKPGAIRLAATSPGLKEARIALRARRCALRPTVP